MSVLFEQVTFISVGAGSISFDFNGSNTSGGLTETRVMAPVIPTRGGPRPRMQQHGNHPRAQVFGALEIDHEGIFLGDTQPQMLAERDAFLAALLGDLSAPIGALHVGTLTVRRLGWGESASAAVSIDSYGAPVGDGDIERVAFQVQWRTELPYLIGDDSGDPVLL